MFKAMKGKSYMGNKHERKMTLIVFLRLYFTFGERGREGEREGNIDVPEIPLAHPQLGTWPTTQAWALAGDQTSDLLVHSSTLNPLSHASQGKTALIMNINSIYYFPLTRVLPQLSSSF